MTEVVEFTGRPWGGFRTVYSDKYATVKILEVNPESAISLQYHEKREEFWTLLLGVADIVINGWHLTMQPGVRYHIPRNVIHRIINRGVGVVEILEVAVGEFDEDDIVRIHDRYGR